MISAAEVHKIAYENKNKTLNEIDQIEKYIVNAALQGHTQAEFYWDIGWMIDIETICDILTSKGYEITIKTLIHPDRIKTIYIKW